MAHRGRPSQYIFRRDLWIGVQRWPYLYEHLQIFSASFVVPMGDGVAFGPHVSGPAVVDENAGTVEWNWTLNSNLGRPITLSLKYELTFSNPETKCSWQWSYNGITSNLVSATQLFNQSWTLYPPGALPTLVASFQTCTCDFTVTPPQYGDIPP